MNAPSPTPAPLLVTAREASRLLAISQRTLWGWSAPRGSIPTIRLGRSVRYSVERLQDWLDWMEGNGDDAPGADGGPGRE